MLPVVHNIELVVHNIELVRNNTGKPLVANSRDEPRVVGSTVPKPRRM